MVNIHLRELERADLPRLNVWRNDPEVINLLGANFLFISPQVEDSWFDAYLTSREKSVRLSIVVTEIDLCIGVVNLTSIHSINRSAEFSIMIGDRTYWSQGVGRQATGKMLNHGFSNLNLHRIYLTVLTNNTRARRLYNGFGFQEEGIQREAVYKEGAFHDVVAMALLNSEFNQPK